jgi:hypothetical protein
LYAKSKSAFVRRRKVFLVGHGWVIGRLKHFLVSEHVKTAALTGLPLKVFPASKVSG